MIGAPPQILNGSRELATPLSGMVCNHELGLAAKLPEIYQGQTSCTSRLFTSQYRCTTHAFILTFLKFNFNTSVCQGRKSGRRLQHIRAMILLCMHRT